MADTDTTVVPETPETPTTVDTPVTPSQDNGSENTDVEALKAQLSKLEMERNLLRKKVDTSAKELEDKTKKELEEKEDYRALAEKATSQLEALQKEKRAAETKEAIETATSDVFKEFDPKVVEAAKVTGLSVSDDSDEAKEALKTKLTQLATTIGISAPVITGNNPAPQTPNEENAPKFGTWANSKGSDWTQRGAILTKNSLAANNRLGNLESVKVMRASAGVEPQEL